MWPGPCRVMIIFWCVVFLTGPWCSLAAGCQHPLFMWWSGNGFVQSLGCCSVWPSGTFSSPSFLAHPWYSGNCCLCRRHGRVDSIGHSLLSSTGIPARAGDEPLPPPGPFLLRYHQRPWSPVLHCEVFPGAEVIFMAICCTKTSLLVSLPLMAISQSLLLWLFGPCLGSCSEPAVPPQAPPRPTVPDVVCLPAWACRYKSDSQWLGWQLGLSLLYPPVTRFFKHRLFLKSYWY